jgi:GTP cyclohydrolase II
LTGDIFGSYRCDCGNQLQSALEAISKRGNGMLIYIRSHEGRGIGIGNKIAAYALQDHGEDTYSANKRLGFQADQRDYSDAIAILKMEHYTDIDLITNNPEKINALIQAGIQVSQYSIPSKLNEFNEKYLQDKKKIGNHQIEII